MSKNKRSKSPVPPEGGPKTYDWYKDLDLSPESDQPIHPDPDQRDWYYDGHGVKRPRTHPDRKEEDN